MDEIGLKFAVPPASLPALARALGQGHVSVTRMQTIYFDTAHERLGCRGATLRLRKAGRRRTQTAKASTADTLRRLEHDVPAPVPRGMCQPGPDLSRHDGEPVGAALRLALGDPADGQAAGALEARFRTDVSRVARTVCHGGALIELSPDRGTITADDRMAPVAEFELERERGGPGPHRRERARAGVGRRLTAMHALLARDAKRFARLDPRRQHRVASA